MSNTLKIVLITLAVLFVFCCCCSTSFVTVLVARDDISTNRTGVNSTPCDINGVPGITNNNGTCIPLEPQPTVSPTFKPENVPMPPMGEGAPITDDLFGSRLRPYVNETYGFGLQYPSTWRAQEGRSGVIVSFVSPRSSNDDAFVENLNIAIADNNDGKNLEAYTEFSKDDLRKTYPDIALIKEGKAFLSGNQAYQVEYETVRDNRALKVYQLWTIVEEKVYIITFSSTKAEYETYTATIDKMIKSFRFA